MVIHFPAGYLGRYMIISNVSKIWISNYIYQNDVMYDYLSMPQVSAVCTLCNMLSLHGFDYESLAHKLEKDYFP